MDLHTILGLIARHALTALAGVLVAHGYLQSSATEQFISACLLVIGVGWSWWQKTGQAQVAAELAKIIGERVGDRLRSAARNWPPDCVPRSAEHERERGRNRRFQRKE